MVDDSLAATGAAQALWEFIGSGISSSIFSIARLLINDAVPGLVSLAILLVLTISVIAFAVKSLRQKAALDWMRNQIARTDDEAAFTYNAPALDATIAKASENKSRLTLCTAWKEYRETLILDDAAEPPVLRNSVRPDVFFNIESLQYGPKLARYAPGLFVTVGLLLTFLGLIAALQAVNIPPDATPEQTREALSDLLAAASAKFIMSLTGLFASIVFTLALRFFSSKTETAVHAICALLESRLSFLSLEDIAMRQLVVAQGQQDGFRTIGLELVERLGEPLRKEIPETIASSIGTAMAPLIDRVSQVGTDGVGQMVQDLSSRLSDDVGRALTDAGAQLSAAGDKIAMLADRMDQSAGQMGQEMEGSVSKLAIAAEQLTSRLSTAAERTDSAVNAGAEKLLSIMSSTLEGIRANTAEGSLALQQAADTMREAASVFREQLDAAAESGTLAIKQRMETVSREAQGAISATSTQVIDQVTSSGSTMMQATTEFADRLRSELFAPIDELVVQLNKMTTSIADGSGQIAAAAGNIRAGGDASREAADSLSAASTKLLAASQPIGDSVHRLESSVTSLSQTTKLASDTVSQSAKQVAEHAASILRTANMALEGEQQSLQTVLSALRQLLTKMEAQRDQVDSLDDKLGHAFSLFASQVNGTIKNLHSHVGEMNSSLTQGVDTLRQVVDQAEKFVPQSRR